MKVKSQLIDAQLEARDSAPTKRGEILLNTDDSNQVQYHDGSQTRTVVNTDQAQTLKNKTYNLGVEAANKALKTDASGDIVTSTVTSTELEYLSGVTGPVQAQINDKASNSDLSSHASSKSTHGVGEIVGTSEEQVLTNKDIDGGTASNTNRITLPKNTKANLDGLTRKEGTIVYSTDTKKAYIDDGVLLRPIGSGDGDGTGINYIVNGGAEDGAIGTLYNDSAATPVDGTGGTVSGVTWEISGDSPLRGTKSFVLSKDASNRQGIGVAIDFDIDRADKYSVLEIGAEYLPSGTYADGDVQFWIIGDPDGAKAVRQPVGYRLLNVGVESKLTGVTFQNEGWSKIRLCIHIASTSANAYSIKFDSLSVGPQVKSVGPFISDWYSWTPTGTWTTNTTYSGRWRRVGGEMEVQVAVTLSGPPNDTALRVNLPPGFVINPSKLPAGASNLGSASIVDQGTRAYVGTVVYISSTQVGVNHSEGDGGGSVAGTAPFSFASTDIVSLNFKVPIQGWEPSQVLSSETDTRVVAGHFGTDTMTVVPSEEYTKVNFTKVVYDTHGAYDPSTSTYTVPVSGFYRIFAKLQQGLHWLPIGAAELLIFKNGTHAKTIWNMNFFSDDIYVPTASGHATLELKAGDKIDIRVWQYNFEEDTIYFNPGQEDETEYFWWEIERISGPQQIAASESVSASYRNTAGTAVTNSSDTIIPFPTKLWDTHNAYDPSTGQFTCPVSGEYEVSGTITLDNTSYNAGHIFSATVYLDNVPYKLAGQSIAEATSTTVRVISFCVTVRCNAGQKIDLRAYSSVNSILYPAGPNSHITFRRVGN